MSSFLFANRFLVLASMIFSAMAMSAIAAEPKLINTKHEEVAREQPEEVTETRDAAPAYSPQWPEPPNAGALLIRLFFGTVMILGLAVGIIWFGKPWLQRLQVGGASNGDLKIEGSIAIGNRAMLYLVRAGETQLVAGTDATGLKSLIALPAAFKDVLDARVPETDEVVQPQASPLMSTMAFRFGAKE